MSDHSEQDIVVDVASPKQDAELAKNQDEVDTSLKNGQAMDDDIDNVDTDDLLDEADEVISSSKLQLYRTSGKGGSTGRSRRRRSRNDMDVDSGNEKRKTKRKPSAKKDKGKKIKKPASFDPERVSVLTEKYPDPYWKFHAGSDSSMVQWINEDIPLENVPTNMSDQAAISSMTLSSDGSLLATFSSVGAIKVWDIADNFKLVRKLRDADEKNIDEFYCGKFASPSQSLMVAGGKLKDRHRWSTQDEDNHILPCPIKIFNIEEGKVIGKLEGHMEEILCIKTVDFDGDNYYISTSQDGYIIKWHMQDNWTSLIESTKMDDGVTCMAFTVSFVPNTGNKYFLAACDEHLRLYDFEEAQLLQTFEDIYSSYCDCGKFVKWIDEEEHWNSVKEDVKEDMDEDTKAEDTSDVDIKVEDDTAEAATNETTEQSTLTLDPSSQQYAWFISRGAEMCDVSDGVSSKPNTCTLHRLVYPTKAGEPFKLEEVKRYRHEDYHANSWLVKISSNGRYVLAPTIYGQIFVFNMLTEKLTAIVKYHEDMEVRDVVFHPYRPLIFSCGDDGYVKVYTYQGITDGEVEQDLDVGMSRISPSPVE